MSTRDLNNNIRPYTLTELSTKRKRLAALCLVGVCLAFVVIMLGAVTRLTDAGLGCPDWPGCYGHLTVPTSVQALKTVNHLFPAKPVVAHKAWMEMVHRYFAGTLALLIAVIVVMAWRLAPQIGVRSRGLTVALGLLLLYQPILGMWTVTWKLLPIIVSQHLLGGFGLLALLWAHYWLFRQDGVQFVVDPLLKRLALIAVVLIILQMCLGAWTSTNYAAISCDSFPMCQLTPWHWDFKQAFTVFRPIGVNYDGGLISDDAKRTIQMVHRMGALIITLYLFVLCAVAVWRQQQQPRFVRTMMILAGILLLQICLGIANVLLARPLLIAVLHNITAVSLLLVGIRALIMLNKGDGHVSA